MAFKMKASIVLQLGIIFGIQLMILITAFTAIMPTASSKAVAPKVHLSTTSSVLIEGVPVRLRVPRLKLDVQILPGNYHADLATWTLNKTAAQYDKANVLPNNLAGNTYIYGHNNRHVFQRLPLIEPGDIIEVTTSNGYLFTYQTVRYIDTYPDDVDAIAPSVKPQLTLQTCVGEHYELRRLFYLDFKHVRSL